MTETITVAKGPFQAAWDALRNPNDYNGVPNSAGYACAMLEIAHALGEKARPTSEVDVSAALAEVEQYLAAARRSGSYFGRDTNGKLALFKSPPTPPTNHAA